ncbi:hypothetical protein HSBAA_29480 [Vreelandella sulfidaeris]|uniref:Uncharacterized protein n=1 Tax=Vreelandella sulfidaeris TaxID=115553 RepID=A0A455U686_9GAMM|nr:hypothetical protein HSBAA_29480 [Halomonas sulfidaeris]
MTIETTLVALEATNRQLVEEVVLVKTTSTEAQNVAVAARDRAETAAVTTEETRDLMLARFRDFSEIEAAVATSDDNAQTTTANRTHIEELVIHVDDQRAHLDQQRAHLDAQRAHEDSQRAHVDSQRSVVDAQTTQVREDATQVAADLLTVTADRERAEIARQEAEALYEDLSAVNQAALSAQASSASASASESVTSNNRIYIDEQKAHVDEQKAHVDSQVVHVGEQVTHVDAQAEHINAQRAHIDQRASEVNTSADNVATNVVTVNEHKNITLTAKAASEAARDESREWATGDGVVGVVNAENRYSARKEADRSLAERQTAEAAATASKNSADNSAASAANASASEANTNIARIEAMMWAAQDEDIEIAPGLFSAKHYMLKTRTIATGTLIYVGSWDASTGVYPSAIAPSIGHFYKVSVAGTINGEEFLTGDQIIFNGTDWDHVDNTERVTSVGGFIGDVSDSQLMASIKRVHGESSGLNADLLDGKHASDFHLKTDFAFEGNRQRPDDSRREWRYLVSFVPLYIRLHKRRYCWHLHHQDYWWRLYAPFYPRSGENCAGYCLGRRRLETRIVHPCGSYA